MEVSASRQAVTLTRLTAVTITFGVGAASFALSFTALRDLATRGHIPAGQAWLWPLMVDGAILLATLGVVIMAGDDPQYRDDRRFFWWVLGGGAAVSITCNALHAILPADQPLNAWFRGFLAGVAPAALLVTTHGLTLLTRMQRRNAVNPLLPRSTEDQAQPSVMATDEPAAEVGQPMPSVKEAVQCNQALVPCDDSRSDSADPHPYTVPADSRWHQVAPRVLENISLKDAGCGDVAQVLYLSFERTMTNREIGRHLAMSHHTVGKIQAAAARVLRDEQDLASVAS